MSEYINKIIIPTLDGECELSLDHKANVDDVYNKEETYNKTETYNKEETFNKVKLTQSEYNKLDTISENTIYVIPGKRIYLGKECIWKKPKNVLAGLFTEDSKSQNWLVEINGADKSLVEYAELDAKDFYLDFDTIKEDLTSIRFGFASRGSGGWIYEPRTTCWRKVYHMPDTSKVTSFNKLFYACKNLVSVDMSNCNTPQVTDMSEMFESCESLISLDLFNLDTSSVTNMSLMFHYCSPLTTLDLSNFNTSQVTNMGAMFSGCSALTSLDISSFDTSNVTNMGSMFSSCSSLTSLDLSNFDTSEVTTMYGMFSSCSSLTTLALSNFNTSKITEMVSMFSGCSSLTTLDLSNFNTSLVTHMTYMFSSCTSLTTLNISNFDTSSVRYMTDMFKSCTSLTTVKGPITGIKVDLDLHYSPLTADSAMVFINGLSTVTSTKTLKLKSTTYDLLTPEQRAIATSKGWNVTRS